MSIIIQQRRVVQALKEAGFDSPSLEARLLLSLATGLDQAALIAHSERLLTADESAKLEDFLRRRLGHEPIARLSGQREFYGRNFQLNEACLIPRPDTETLIEAVLARAAKDKPLSIIDFGTGPGTILLTLLAELPLARGLGTDLSGRALEAAQDNASRFGVSARASFIQSSWVEGVNEPFDIVVSNPPYIARTDMMTLQDEVKLHDPSLALDGGEDGLDPYRILFPALKNLLNSNGFAAFEFGLGQAAALQSLAAQQGFNSSIRKDLGGLERVIIISQVDHLSAHG